MSNIKTKKIKEKKPKPKYSLLSNCIYIIKDTKNTAKSLLFTGLIAAVITAIVPFNSIIFPKLILEELTTTMDTMTLIYILGAFMIASVVLAYLPHYFDGINMPKFIWVRILKQKDTLAKCLTTDFANTENPDFLDKLNNVNNNIFKLEQLNTSMFRMVGCLLGVAGFTGILATLNPFILILVLISVGLTYYTNYVVNKYNHSLKDEVANVDRKSNYLFNTMINFAYGKELRIFGLADWFISLFLKEKKDRIKLYLKVENKRFYLSFLTTFVNVLRDLIIYAYLIYMVIWGNMTIANFTMYFATITSFSSWLNMIILEMSVITGSSMFISDIREFLETENEEEKNTVPIPKGPYEIEFKNVYFKYPRSDKYVYENISLKIDASKRLAIVGHNGAGKTTFIKLICRLYKPEKGEILLNGININKFKLSEYLTLFSAVFQEIKTLAFSVLENVTVLPNDELDRNKAIEALKKADVYEKIASLKKGVDTPLLKMLDDDGVELSGGENQKVSLARAIYKNAGIMLLDEPTSALDPIAEQNTYLKFDSVIRGKTAIYISHRLASTQFCDNIALFEQGKLIEYGTHKELLEKDGKYADMFKIQAKYYVEGGSDDEQE